MALNLYYQDDEANLIFLADAEQDGSDELDPLLFLDMFLDEADEDQKFDAYLIIDDEAGTAIVLEVADHDPSKPRRSISVMGADDDEEEEEKPEPTKRRGRPPGSKAKSKIKIEELPADDEEDDEPEEKPAPKRRGRPPGTKNKTGAKKPGPKSGKTFAQKEIAKNSGMKKNSDSEE
jgi:hypothetical protein